MSTAVYFGFKHQFERARRAAKPEGVRVCVLQADARGGASSNLQSAEQ